jgi:hypothetical protein
VTPEALGFKHWHNLKRFNRQANMQLKRETGNYRSTHGMLYTRC